MATIEKPIESMTNEELSNALRIRGVQYGPIVASTRNVYEKKLRKLLAGNSDPVQVESNVEGDSSPVRTTRSRQTKPDVAAADEIQSVRYPAAQPVPSVLASQGQRSATPLKQTGLPPVVSPRPPSPVKITREPSPGREPLRRPLTPEKRFTPAPRNPSPERFRPAPLRSDFAADRSSQHSFAAPSSQYTYGYGDTKSYSSSSHTSSSTSQLSRRSIYNSSDRTPQLTQLNSRYPTSTARVEGTAIKTGWLSTAKQLGMFIVIAILLYIILSRVDIFSSSLNAIDHEQTKALDHE